jgi:hypothetical protein
VKKRCPEFRKAESISNLIKNPAKGGIPLLENRSIAKSVAISGWRSLRLEN